MGYEGSEGTTRRAVAEAKRRWRQKHGRRTLPRIPEPGLWLQWDYAEGPVVAGARTVLFCAWLAWVALSGRGPAAREDHGVGGDWAGSDAEAGGWCHDVRVDR
jgi:hypothetical protein